MKIFDEKLLKFLIVGFVNTFVGAGIMFALYNFLGCTYWFSSICNYIAGGIVSFFLNKFFTFKNNKKSISQVLLFIISILFCYLISYMGAKKIIYFILQNVSQKTADNYSMLLAMCLYTALNYITQRFIVFNDSKTKNITKKDF